MQEGLERGAAPVPVLSIAALVLLEVSLENWSAVHGWLEPMIEFFGRGGRLKPSWYGDCLPSRDFPMLIELYLQGRLDLDRFVSETIGLDGVEEAFAKMGRGEVLRSVVVMDAWPRRSRTCARG